jgi:predicted MFS family arabinose efflux permease
MLHTGNSTGRMLRYGASDNRDRLNEVFLPAGARGIALPRWAVVSVLGVCQILAWGSSYYLLAVLAVPIAIATGWSATWILGGLSVGLLVSGLVSRRVGRTIDRRGGRPVLASSAALLAAGMLCLAAAPNVIVYVAAWIIIGLGMGTGLYDPAFSTLGRLYGQEARPLITGTTLFGGFASTVCWPLSAVLLDQVGWRGTCLAYAGIHLFVVLPLYLFAIPREKRHEPVTAAAKNQGRTEHITPGGDLLFWLLALSLTLASVIMTVVSVELIALLQARGLTLATAVGLGTLVGPAQVGARVVEFTLGRRAHPIWTMLVSMVLVAVGLGFLMFGPTLIGIGLALYGAGGGIRSIVRGTLPLRLFGHEGYATMMGRLASPSLVAQAASPAIGAILLEGAGADATILVLTAAAIVNVVSVLVMVPLIRR